jgi:hypothetical protein
VAAEPCLPKYRVFGRDIGPYFGIDAFVVKGRERLDFFDDGLGIATRCA